MKIIEQFTISKSGKQEINEDRIAVSDNYILLVDGATSKIKQTINGLFGGQWIAAEICEIFQMIDLSITPHALLSFLSEEILFRSKTIGYNQIPSASIIFYNDVRKEIVRYGDINLLIDKNQYPAYKEIDKIHSKKRADYIEQCLLNGISTAELLQNDLGRKHILSDLLQLSRYANKLCQYGFPTINGDKIVKEYIDIYDVKNASKIVFGSDGYPVLKDSLKASEETLAELLRVDPLCYKENRSTKGITPGNISFDDRSYISFEL